MYTDSSSVPNTTGSVPNTTGSVPYTTGSVPYTTGSVPNTTGSVPYTTGSVPYTTGSVPNTTGSVPNTTGSVPYTTGSVPYTTGSVPYTTGYVPYTTGSVPNTTGSVPYTTGSVPYTTGSVPYTTGSVPYTTDQYSDYSNTLYGTSTEPAGCEYGDRVDQCNVDNGRRCYDANIRRDCCSTCQSYETSVPGCRYGDKVSNCKETECPNYSPQRLANCCDTCYTGTWSSTSSSTDNLVTSGTSESSGVPGWTVPVAASIGGVLVLVIVIVVVVLCRRNKKSDNLSPIDDQMYNEYKLSKRAPMAPPRHPSTEKGWVDESKETDYAYISPDHVEGPQSNARRTGSDPLPPTPAEYLDLTDAHTVASDYDSSRNNDVSHDVQNHDRATSNKYEKFPGSSAYVNQPENGDVSYKL